jgi:hypothetical protein
MREKANKKDCRVVVCALGRRWGKTVGGIDMALDMGLHRAPLHIGWFAHQNDAVRVAWEEMVKRVPHTAVSKKLDSLHDLQIVNGTRVEMFSTDNPDKALGRAFDIIFIDEGARVSAEARDQAIAPMVADTNGPIIVFTTPKGKKGPGRWVYRDFRKAQAGEPGYYCMQGPTYENPNKNIQEWAEWAKDNLPKDIYEQEVLATFLDYGAGVLDFTDVCTEGGTEQEPVEIPYDAFPGDYKESPVNEDCIMGLDLAQRNNWMVATVLGMESGILYAMDRYRHLPWEVQVERAGRLAKKYRCLAFVDATGLGGPITEMMEEADVDVEPVVFTSDVKQTLIQGLQVAVERREIRTPYIAEMVAEGETFEAELLQSGRVRYQAGEGFDDDIVTSLALAVYGRQRCLVPAMETVQ